MKCRYLFDKRLNHTNLSAFFLFYSYDAVNAEASTYLSAILRGQCQSWEYQCKKSGECVPISFLCDFKRHCEDGSDEEECGIIASILSYGQSIQILNQNLKS